MAANRKDSFDPNRSILGQRTYLTIDNFYTTPRLAKYLLERKTKIIGTTIIGNVSNRFLKDSDIPKGSAAFKRYENILAIKYRAAKNKSDGKPKVIHLLSIKYNAAMMVISYRNLMPLFTTTKTWEE